MKNEVANKKLVNAQIGGALFGAPSAILGLIGFILLAPSGLIGWAVISLVVTTLCGGFVGAFISVKMQKKK